MTQLFYSGQTSISTSFVARFCCSLFLGFQRLSNTGEASNIQYVMSNIQEGGPEQGRRREGVNFVSPLNMYVTVQQSH